MCKKPYISYICRWISLRTYFPYESSILERSYTKTTQINKLQKKHSTAMQLLVSITTGQQTVINIYD